jgi:peroxiredoxin
MNTASRLKRLGPTLPLLAVLCLGWGLDVPAAGPDVSGMELKEIPDRPAAPGFALPDIDGEIHRLSDYRGKVVVVNFWATWCPPCREEMPAMQRAWEQVRDEGIVILAVNIGENEDQIFTFTGNYAVDFPLLMDRDSSAIRQWPIKGLPTSYVIDPAGRVAYRAIGGRAWDAPEILEQLRALKASAPAADGD